MELISMVAKNSLHNVAKPFERGATLKGLLINAKSVKMGMLLERIKNLVEAEYLLLDQLNIQNGSEWLMPLSLQDMSPCAHCPRLNLIELDCLVMAVQGQDMFRQGPQAWPSQQGRPNYLSA